MSTGLSPDIDRPHTSPTLTLEASLVVLSALGSLVGAGLLGESMRVRWTIGTYYGPTHAPTALVLLAFPLALAVLYAGFRWLASMLARHDDAATNVKLLRACALLSLGAVLATQVLLIGLNVV